MRIEQHLVALARIGRQPERATGAKFHVRQLHTTVDAAGYLRVDSVHQGDFDGIKGLYVINLVDAVTQFEVVVAVERISEHFLIPALRLAMAAFPFVLRGFHSDNGSEYINYQLGRIQF